jgi:hypothetical protein
MVLTGEQLTAAMALVRIGRDELASRSAIPSMIIESLERTVGELSGSFCEAEALRDALERAGVDFFASGADRPEGPGVRLRDGFCGTTIPLADLNASDDE